MRVRIGDRDVVHEHEYEVVEVSGWEAKRIDCTSDLAIVAIACACRVSRRSRALSSGRVCARIQRANARAKRRTSGLLGVWACARRRRGA